MDERSQHGHPQPPQVAPEHAQPLPHTAGNAPWPSYAPPVPNAPIAGHAPYPGPAAQHAPVQQQFPTTHQFQYAANGYVLPGASESQGAPMSAHGGTIGVAQPYEPGGFAMPAHHAHPQAFAQPHTYAQPQGPTQPHGHAQPQASGAGMVHQMLDVNGHPQSWAFPTPNGLQLVQPGATSMAQGSGMHGASAGVATTRRMRWETIVPAVAVMCLIVAIGLFMHDFDRITGRTADAASPSAETTRQVDAKPAATDDAGSTDVQATLKSATALFGAGKFDQAANLLHPLLDVPSPDPAVVTLHDKVDAANARENALLKRLAAERRGKRWTAVVTTIGQVEQLRPLDRQLVALRTRARAAATAARQAKLKRAAAARAAAKQREAAPSNSGRAMGGGHAGHAMPPVAGGNRGATTNVRPPADVPKGAIPAVPNVPNPTGGSAGVIGGGQAAETMCDVPRTARHGDEVHAHC